MAVFRRFWFLAGLFLGSCAGFTDWDEYAKYQENRGFNRQEYERKLFGNITEVSSQKESQYEKELKNTYVNLLRNPPSPVKIPDTVIRVLILPYVSEDGSLSSSKYVFFKAEEGRWILGKYLLKEGGSPTVLTPLEEGEEDAGQ